MTIQNIIEIFGSLSGLKLIKIKPRHLNRRSKNYTNKEDDNNFIDTQDLSLFFGPNKKETKFEQANKTDEIIKNMTFF